MILLNDFFKDGSLIIYSILQRNLEVSKSSPWITESDFRVQKDPLDKHSTSLSGVESKTQRHRVTKVFVLELVFHLSIQFYVYTAGLKSKYFHLI